MVGFCQCTTECEERVPYTMHGEMINQTSIQGSKGMCCYVMFAKTVSCYIRCKQLPNIQECLGGMAPTLFRQEQVIVFLNGGCK